MGKRSPKLVLSEWSTLQSLKVTVVVSENAMCFGRESQKEPGYGIFHVKFLRKTL